MYVFIGVIAVYFIEGVPLFLGSVQDIEYLLLFELCV